MGGELSDSGAEAAGSFKGRVVVSDQGCSHQIGNSPTPCGQSASHTLGMRALPAGDSGKGGVVHGQLRQSLEQEDERGYKHEATAFLRLLYPRWRCDGRLPPRQPCPQLWCARRTAAMVRFRQSKSSRGTPMKMSRARGDEMREVMDIRQASEYLGISPDTLYKYASDGFIPAFKLGNRWRFRRSRLEEWMDRQSGIIEMPAPKLVQRQRKPVRALRAITRRPAARAS
jgi:excisionase family DNA binding protein